MIDLRFPENLVPSSRALIVAALRQSPRMSRRDIGSHVGVGAPTVTSQVRRLIAGGLIRELPSKATGSGRPTVPLELVDEAGFVLGAAVEPGLVRLHASSLSGGVLDKTVLPLPHRFDDIVQALSEILAQWAQTRDNEVPCLATGLAIPGVVDPSTRRVRIATVLGWTNDELDLPTVGDPPGRIWLSNDMVALATQSVLHIPPEIGSTFMKVFLGAGIGMAIVRDGVVQTGHSGGASEFAHVSVNPEGPACRCGNLGCIQVYAGEREVCTAVAEATGLTPDSWSWFRNEAPAEPDVESILDHAGYWLGRAVGAAVTLTGINVVLITGPGIRAWSSLVPGFDLGLAETTRTLVTDCRILLESWDDYRVAEGAASLALAQSLTETYLADQT